MSLQPKIAFLVCSLLFWCFAPTAQAFYKIEGEKGYLEARGFLRVWGLYNENPGNRWYYPNEDDQSTHAIGRLLLDGGLGEHISFELNLYQYYTHASTKGGGGQWEGLTGVERSSSVDLRWLNNAHNEAHLELDRLNLRLMFNDLDVTIGRRPINLATAFYFTPNDFFAPFAAQTFFRVYKPGVDAMVMEKPLGELSQFTLMGVLGYHPDPSASNGWSNTVSWARSSALARFSTSWSGFDWAILAGRVGRKVIAGIGIQGEMWEWLGVRVEGHHAIPTERGKRGVTEFTFALEHRFENSLEIHLEQFYHGSGEGSVGNYDLQSAAASILPYLGKNYSALGLTYEATPLLNIQLLSMLNWIDYSTLFSFYSVYSLSNESELSFGFSIPVGKEPVGRDLESEFGSYPAMFNLEFRVYF